MDSHISGEFNIFLRKNVRILPDPNVGFPPKNVTLISQANEEKRKSLNSLDVIVITEESFLGENKMILGKKNK